MTWRSADWPAIYIFFAAWGVGFAARSLYVGLAALAALFGAIWLEAWHSRVRRIERGMPRVWEGDQA